jgi:hypothetical protein
LEAAPLPSLTHTGHWLSSDLQSNLNAKSGIRPPATHCAVLFYSRRQKTFYPERKLQIFNLYIRPPKSCAF